MPAVIVCAKEALPLLWKLISSQIFKCGLGCLFSLLSILTEASKAYTTCTENFY